MTTTTNPHQHQDGSMHYKQQIAELSRSFYDDLMNKSIVTNDVRVKEFRSSKDAGWRQDAAEGRRSKIYVDSDDERTTQGEAPEGPGGASRLCSVYGPNQNQGL